MSLESCHLNATRSMVIAICFSLNASKAAAQIRFEREPVSYSAAQPENEVTRLITKIDSGAVRLQYTQSHGYLESLLEHLGDLRSKLRCWSFPRPVISVIGSRRKPLVPSTSMTMSTWVGSKAVM